MLKISDTNRSISQTEVHILLLTDMLLICKPSTKKTSSSGLAGTVGGGLKIIRQPYVIDRIRIHELKEPSSLGLIYLNEYGAASAALVLSAGESKLAKVRSIFCISHKIPKSNLEFLTFHLRF